MTTTDSRCLSLTADPGQDSPPSAFREPPLPVRTEPSLQVPWYLHFTEEETEAQRGYVTHLGDTQTHIPT